MSNFRDLFLLLAIVLFTAKVAGTVCRRLGQPAVLGEIIAGLILGPTAFDVLNIPLFSESPDFKTVIEVLAELGVTALMFLAGIEVDLKALRSVGATAAASAFGGVIVPFLSGLAVGLAISLTVPEAVFLGTIFTATSVSITAQTLLELKALRTKEGTTILGAAIIDDVLGIVILSLVVALTTSVDSGGMSPWQQTAWTLLRIGLFMVVGFVVLAPVVRRVLNWVAEKLQRPGAVSAITMAFVLAYAWAAETFGNLAPITGSFALGAILSSTPSRERLEQSLLPVAYGFLVPFFFVNIGLQADAAELMSSFPLLVFILVLIAITTKLGGSGLGALLTGFNVKESLRVGAGMVARGEVALIVAAIGLEAGLVPSHVFSAVIMVTLSCAVTAPILLRLTFPKNA